MKTAAFWTFDLIGEATAAFSSCDLNLMTPPL